MISYADLEKAYRLERSNPTLQKIPDDFYDQAKQLAENPEVGQYKETILDYVEKIYYQRSNKLIHYAGRATSNTKPPENTLPVELNLYNMIVGAVSETKTSILNKKLEIKTEVTKPMVKVSIKQALPSIVGSDSKEYGPFREDDIVELPQDSAEILIKRKAAGKL